MRAFVPLLTLGLLLGGCGARERANPYDPTNPGTRGRPAGFVAVAGSGYVQLRWQAPVSTDLQGFQLVRRAAGDTAYRVLVPRLSRTTDTFLDTNVSNGRRYDYRLSYIFVDGVSPIGAEDHATPGPLRPWVSVPGSSEAVLLSADGRRIVLAEGGFASPGPIAVDPADGRVWVGDTYTGEVTLLAFGTRIRITSFRRPIAIGLDPRDGSAWICDEDLGEVGHFDNFGIRATPARIGPFVLPIAVAVDSVDGTIWVCDNGARQVQVFNADGTRRRVVDVPRPSRIAIHPLTRDAWVTSFEQGVVMRLPASGTGVQQFPGFSGPIGIAIDGARDRIWVAEAVAGRVLALRDDGSIERAIAGYPEAREVAVDRRTGNAWFVVNRTRRVAVIAPNGAEVGAVEGLSSPAGIALDPGR